MQLLLPNGTVYPSEGRLEFSEVTVDPTSGAVTLRATFPNPDGLLLPGLYVRAKLVEGIRQQAIMAPQQGISHDPRGRATAMVVNAQNKVEPRVVTTDRAVGDKWIVTERLEAGRSPHRRRIGQPAARHGRASGCAATGHRRRDRRELSRCHAISSIARSSPGSLPSS